MFPDYCSVLRFIIKYLLNLCCFSRKDHIIVFAEEIEEEEYGILLSEKLLSKVIPTLKVVEMSVVAPSGPKVVQQA